LREHVAVDRAALIPRYREPIVRWINEADPDPEAISISLADVNVEWTVCLVGDEDEDVDTTIRRWVEDNSRALRESDLEAWYTDEASWPADRTCKKFDAWFEVECHTVLVDMVDGPLLDDET